MTVLSANPSSNDPKALYINLLLRCVANTIYQDDPQDNWSGGSYSEDARQSGLDWPSKAHTMIGVQRLDNLRALCEQALDEKIPGDFIETGVWRGGACILMRGILEAYGDTERKVIVADSFAGLPEAKPEHFPADKGDTHHTFEELAISEDTVRANFATYGLLDGQVEFLKGWFSDTLPTVRNRTFALIRLDGDMYQSTIEALENLYDRLSPGGFVIIDDYGAIPACKQAVEDFRTANQITEPLKVVDWTGVWWRKPA
jgi:SAM-dependent methyltransferase